MSGRSVIMSGRAAYLSRPLGITDAQLAPHILPPRLLELTASAIMAASSILVGLLQLHLAARAGMPALARALMATSGISLLVPMALAGLYALGSFEGAAWIDIEAMLRYHGAVNALGFALPGVRSWQLIPDGREAVGA
jgi:YndJ-like protein